MATDNKYPYISVAYKSRFLFCTEAEYREAWGVSFETVAKNRYSGRDMEVYYGILNRKARLFINTPLDDLVDDYAKASQFYLNLDWGDRSQMASRKRFCRMLYRLFATGGRSLTADEIVKFKMKDDDDRLLREFFPDGVGGEPAVSVSYIVLFAFGVVRPWRTDVSRGRDIGDNETMKSLTKLKSLIELLKSDMLRFGSTERPMAFDEWLCEIDSRLKSGDIGKCCILWIAVTLLTISMACQTMADVEHSRQASESYNRICTGGIWVDDADQGDGRFWIFAHNNIFALCYRRDGVAWEMLPYEFLVRERDDSEDKWAVFMVDCRDDLHYTFSSDMAIELSQLCTGCCEREMDETTGELRKIVMEEDTLPFPSWLTWRQWTRLSPDDERYKEYRSVLNDIYDPLSPHSALFRNAVPEITDGINCLVGRDKKYLYVYDWRPKRSAIKETSPDVFVYEGVDRYNATLDALFEMEISAEHPLYAIPVDMKGKRYGSADLDRMAEIMTDADNIKDVNILHSYLAPHPRLVFTSYGFSISLDMEALQKAGVKKFTSSPF